MGGVNHFDLVVSDLERSLPVYRELLEPLGYTRARGGYDRYRVGIHHVAFQAPSREIVDERLRWVHEHGLEVENDPREYDYRPGYCVGFFYDPDGIKLEIVHVP